MPKHLWVSCRHCTAQPGEPCTELREGTGRGRRPVAYYHLDRHTTVGDITRWAPEIWDNLARNLGVRAA